MTEHDFVELMRRTMSDKGFNEATSAVIILFKEDGENVYTRIRGFYNSANAETIAAVAALACEDIPLLVNEETKKGGTN